jgi:hypothetical protein
MVEERAARKKRGGTKAKSGKVDLADGRWEMANEVPNSAHCSRS